MGMKFHKLLVITTIFLMVGMSLMPATGSSPADENRGPGPMTDPAPWTDGLDDLSHVYVPGSGLVGIEVSGGDAHLKAGSNSGWLASEIITCPPGFRYDLVVLEVDTPGDSEVLLSILNASADPGEVGFANETIGTLKLMNVTDLALTSVNPALYPEIRIQASLVASGTDRPRLLSWTLYYIGLDEWRDDFRGSGKMREFDNINFTGDKLEVDLGAGATGGGPGVGDYDPYPPIVIAGYSAVRTLYPNAGNTDYKNEETLSASYCWGVVVEDLDQDGFLDVVAAAQSGSSTIFWGDSSGTYSDSRKDDLGGVGREVVTADFNGDGWADIGLAGSGGSIFLNDGTGSFSATPDQSIAGSSYYAAAGDFNGDGYGDMLFSYPNSNIHYGGPTGISTTADVTLAGYYAKAGDLDLDGFDDALTYTTGTGIKVYMGKASGIDAVADYTLVGATGSIYYPNFGDINGDGYMDITGSDYDSGNYVMKVFEGAADGWKSARVHSAWTSNSWARTYAADIDKDGADDLIVAKSTGGYGVEIVSSTPSWTFSELTTKTLSGYIYVVDVAIPKGAGGGPKAYRGAFETIPITVPLDRKWDVAYLDGVFPQNTSAKISVLDDATGKPITGYKELSTFDVDLSGIDPTIHRTIRLDVTIMTELNTTTPVLDSLTVKWMDMRVWRDEFYGPAKVDRMLNIDVAGGTMRAGAIGGQGPQLVFPSLLGNANYTTSPKAFFDAGGVDYLTREPFDFRVKGTVDAAAADVDGDGYTDLAFAVHQSDNVTYVTTSPLYKGGPLGLQDTPGHRFDTTGATAVVLRDIDNDGHVDAVFSQDRSDVDQWDVGSILYWGSADGFADEPDLTFATVGASDVEAADLNGDGLLDLAFACFRDASSTSTDSLVFLQDGTEGFCATAPDHRLPTKGARAVAAGDIDGDGHVDLAFANSLSAGFAEIDSYVYWGKAGGGFESSPLAIPTKGAEDVLIANLDGDGDLDLVIANHWTDGQDLDVDSYVLLGDGTRGIGPGPDFMLPTMGATGVTATDIDGTGWKDLVFSCQRNASSYQVPSYVYLGGASGWSSTPDVEIPTEGAYSVLAVDLLGYGTGGYLSKPIYIDLPARDTGTVHTFRYTATLGASQEAELMLVDADSWEVLASTSMSTGTHEWDLTGQFRVKEHPAIAVMLVASGLEAAGQFTVDSLWFNWTKRVRAPPEVLDLSVSAPSVLRDQSVDLSFDVNDDYDLTSELVITVQERINGTETWDEVLVGDLTYDDATGSWTTTVTPKVNVPVGAYDIRVTALDLDGQYSAWVEFPSVLEVLNNIPTTPFVSIMPENALTTSSLVVELDTRSTDVETTGLTYNYTWYRDGVHVPEVTTDNVPTYLTGKGENWTVEVRAWDGDDFSGAGTSSVVIGNAPPQRKDKIPDPEMDEDTPDNEWINLMNAFSDADGDPITWSVAKDPVNFTVEIDHDTGQVTITPNPDWFGEETLTFIASDGEATASQTVTVLVHSVNDIPAITHIDGEPVTGAEYSYTISQGQPITITYNYADVEGDEVQADVSIPTVDLDESARTITFDPGTDAVGTFTFTFRLWDVVTPGQKVSISFTIEVQNENDPMDDPVINQPPVGSKYKVNQSFSLVGSAFDPDIQYGQELNFSWSSNISGHLGYGSSLTVRILEEGTHNITVTVSDGEFEKSASMDVVIEPRGGTEPPPDPDDDDDGPGINWVLIVGIVVALVIIGVVLFIATGDRRSERKEDRLEAQEIAEEERKAAEDARMAKEAEQTAAAAAAAGWEAEEAEDYEELDMGASDGALSMKATVTEEASTDVKKLWSGIGDAPAEQTDEEKEAMRLDNLKRKYQNAIGRLPYGIPSKELADRDWVELSTVLATGEKKQVEGGKEVTQIDGRWYYSDHQDTGSFLKEHGKKKEQPPAKAPASDKDKLLAKLEERFILGEISEETYKELKSKYS